MNFSFGLPFFAHESKELKSVQLIMHNDEIKHSGNFLFNRKSCQHRYKFTEIFHEAWF